MRDHLRIMIVEDEPLLACQLEDEVADAGHEVVSSVMSGAEALEQADRTHPDLILLDLQLADGDTGPCVARRLSGQQRAVLFVTASARLLPPDLCGAAGAIEKPWSTGGLQAALRYLQAAIDGERTRPPGSLRLPAGRDANP